MPAMVATIDHELLEFRAALTASHGDPVPGPRVAAALLAYLLLSSRALLQNLLIQAASRQRRLLATGVQGGIGTPPDVGASLPRLRTLPDPL